MTEVSQKARDPQNCNNDLCDRVFQRNPRPDPAS